MKYKSFYLTVLSGLLLGSSIVQSAEFVKTVFQKGDSTLNTVSDRVIGVPFRALAKLVVVLYLVKLGYDLTDYKKFNEVSSDDATMKKAFKSLTENLGSVDAARKIITELWYKVVRTLFLPLRAIIGYRSYKVAVKEETITNPDGTKATKKSETIVPATKLCYVLETVVKNLYPTIIALSTGVLGMRQLAQVLQSGNTIEGLSTLPEIKIGK